MEAQGASWKTGADLKQDGGPHVSPERGLSMSGGSQHTLSSCWILPAVLWAFSQRSWAISAPKAGWAEGSSPHPLQIPHLQNEAAGMPCPLPGVPRFRSQAETNQQKRMLN